jgi:hypothetical protein
MAETNIEAILTAKENLHYSPEQILFVLKTYLTKGGENLNLEQYKKMRCLFESNYNEIISEAIKSKRISEQDVKEISRLSTDYIRFHHYKLLEEQSKSKEESKQEYLTKNQIKPNYVTPESEKEGFFTRIKKKVKSTFQETINNYSYEKNWKNRDEKMYLLERKLLEGENSEISSKYEEELISQIPSKGLSSYKLRTFQVLLSNSQNYKELKEVINKHLENDLKKNYENEKEEARGRFIYRLKRLKQTA